MDCHFGLRAHSRFERFFLGIVKSCRIKDAKTKISDLRQTLAPVPRYSRLIIDKGDLAANQSVE